MGGKEGSRGYLYQTFASIFEALCQDDWDKIYVEYTSEDDKVDIALEKNDIVFKSIQVKSNINSFYPSSIISWSKALIKDEIGATEFELFLMGQPGTSAIKFKNALDALQDNNGDKTKLCNEHKKALLDFDASIITGKVLRINFIPFDLDILIRMLIASLLKYLSIKQIALKYDQLEFIVKAMVADNFLSSLVSSGIEKAEFDSKIENYVMMMSKRYFGIKVIGVVTFERGTEYLSDYAESKLSLVDKFDNRKLKPEFDWDIDIYNELNSFLQNNVDPKWHYQIALEVPLSIAFACGRILDPKSRINALPSSPQDKYEVWNINEPIDDTMLCFDIQDERMDINEFDTALIISVTHDIRVNVDEFLVGKNIKLGRKITLTMASAPSNNAIVNGSHANYLVQKVVAFLAQRTTAERRATTHIFASAPNGFMFFLGQQSRGFGNCILYEYDFEGKDTATYSPSFKNLP